MKATLTSSNHIVSFDEVAAPETILQATLRRFRGHRLAVVGVVMLTLVIVYVIGGVFFYTEKYANDTDFRNKWQPPSTEHPMGTDAAGVMCWRAPFTAVKLRLRLASWQFR